MGPGAEHPGLEIWQLDLEAASAGLAALTAEFGLAVPPPAGPPDPHRLTAHLGLRLLLARRLGPVRAKQGFHVGAGGKPSLPDASLDFSLSHSRGQALIALSEIGPVGVDLEGRRPLRMAAARRQAIEHAAMAVAGGRDLAARAGDERTLQAWVRLEAAAKASGEGIGRLLERVGARPGRRGTGARPIPDTPVAAVADLVLADGFHGAIASFDRALLQAPALGVRMLPCDLPELRATIGVWAP